MSLVELQSVRYRYEDAARDALDIHDLSIDSGEFVLLAGASGSGKSTLCRLLNGLIPHFYGGHLEGRVSVDGLETRTHSVRELFAHVGMVFQNPGAQLFNSSVEREIAFGLESLGLPQREILERIQWALQITQLQPLADRAPHELSGGEQQLVALAAILALRPRLLMLDEPFTNLDPEAVERMRSVLGACHADGTTIVLTEHRLHASLQDATRLIVLDQGRKVADGTPRDVVELDLARYHLNTPFIVRLARAQGVRPIPLSAEEARAAGLDGMRNEVSQRPSLSGPPPGAPQVVQMQGVSFEQGGPVLEDVDLSLRQGECVALIGKNGSGKTTLLKHLNGLFKPSLGSVVILGRDTRQTRVSDLARQVGLVFQNPNDQLFKPNVLEEIEAGPRALGCLDREWLDRLVGELSLGPLLAASPFALSEGEKKRVALAAALAGRPEIFALDEPTTGQDGAFLTALAKLLRSLQDERRTIILATHDLEFAEQVAPRWVVLANGHIVADGTPDLVMANTKAMERAALRPTARFLLESGPALERPRSFVSPIPSSQ